MKVTFTEITARVEVACDNCGFAFTKTVGLDTITDEESEYETAHSVVKEWQKRSYDPDLYISNKGETYVNNQEK